MRWKQIYLKRADKIFYCNYWIHSKKAMNIIVTHTPITSTDEMKKTYEPLTNYPVNIFAFDFSGTGKSKNGNYLSRESIVNDLDFLVDHIQKNFSNRIYLYGNTGIGGIFAQYYLSKRNNLKGFAQFSCLSFGKTEGMGYTTQLVRIICPILRFIPNFKINMKPPKYSGYHAGMDDEVYRKMEKGRENFWMTDSKFLLALLEMAVAKDSALKRKITVPTLVFKTNHDRYFTQNHFDEYYDRLKCPKKMIEIDDVHNSYYIYNDYFCKHVFEWFKKIESEMN